MIYFDLDGVLADMESGLMQSPEVKALRVILDDLISSKFSSYEGLVDDDIKSKYKAELEANPESEVKELKKAFNKYTSKVFSVASKPGFYRNLPLMPGAVEMVKKAGEMAGVLPNILSAPVGDENDPNNISIIEKMEWVDEHFKGMFETVTDDNFTSDKGRVVKDKNDILIDDRPKYVEKFEAAGGTAILYKNSDQATAELASLIGSTPPVVERKSYIKMFEQFRNSKYKNKIVESLVEGDDDVYNIVDNDEIGSSYCKDFKVSDLKVGDKIHRVCVSVDDNEYNWCLDTNKIEYYDRMAELSSNFTEYEVVEIDLENNLIKLD